MTKARNRLRRGGFTLVEVMFAAFLLGVVGAAIVGFMSAFATGIQSRAHLNDPALESTLAARRLSALAPAFSTVLQVKPDCAAIWVADSTPTRVVELSEVGVIAYDEATSTIYLETVNPSAFASNLVLDRELAYNLTTNFIGALETARERGQTLRQVLAEGVQSASFTTVGVPKGQVVIVLTMESGSTRIAVAPPIFQEPLR